ESADTSMSVASQEASESADASMSVASQEASESADTSMSVASQEASESADTSMSLASQSASASEASQNTQTGGTGDNGNSSTGTSTGTTTTTTTPTTSPSDVVSNGNGGLQTGEAGATVKKTSTKIKSVSAIKKIGLYKSPTFSTKGRITWYAKEPRTKQPQFVVIGEARSKNGTLRYKVRDVNHGSKTYGLVGYITANKKYVRNTYYQTLTTATKKKTKTITIINPKGVNAYKTASRSGKVAHYRQGQQLKVKRIVHYHLTTRIELTNGRYITANRQWVKTGKVTLKHTSTQRHIKSVKHVQVRVAVKGRYTPVVHRLSPSLSYLSVSRQTLRPQNGPAVIAQIMSRPVTPTALRTGYVQLYSVPVQKMGLYTTPNFSAKTRITWYENLPQAQQPVFLILGTAVSANGTLRFKVLDINPASPTYGQEGYITADQKYMRIIPSASTQLITYRIPARTLASLGWMYDSNQVLRYVVTPVDR
ncbi:DUF5776 domain-containing protein, partial [Levilactobacillus zymae]